MKLGELTVVLNANTTSMLRGLEQAAERVDRFSRQTKKLANEVAQVGTTFAALGGAALHLASQVDATTKRAMDDVTAATRSLAVEVARALLPALREMASMFRTAAQFAAGMDPALKAQISSFAVLAVQVGAAAKVLSLVVGLGGEVVGALGGIAGVIGSIGVGPLLAVAAALAGIILIVGILNKAWRENWGGIREVTAETLRGVKDAFSGVFDFLKALLESFVDQWFGFTDKVLSAMQSIVQAAGSDGSAIEGIRNALSGMQKDLKDGSFVKLLGEGVDQVLTDIVNGAKDGKDAFADMLDPLFKKWDELMAKFKKEVPTNAGNVSIEDQEQMAALNKQFANYRSVTMGPSQWLQHQTDEGTGPLSPKNGQALMVEAEARAKYLRFWEQKTQMELQARTGVVNSLKMAGGMMLSKMGAAGEVAGSAIQGAQMGGGIGAVIGAVTALFTQSESFMRLVNTINGFLGTLLTALAPIFEKVAVAAGNVFGALVPVINVLASFLGPYLERLVQQLNILTPFIYLAAVLFGAFAPIFEMVTRAIAMAFKILRPIISIIFDVVRYVFAGILYAAKGVVDMYNFLIGSIIDLLASIPGFGGAADALRPLLVDTKPFTDSIATLEKQNLDLAESQINLNRETMQNAGAQAEAAKAAERFNEALTNAPEGFKIAAHRFRADSGMSAAWPGISVEQASGGLMSYSSAGGGGGNMYVQNMTVETSDPDAVYSAAENARRRKNFQRNGNPHRDD